MLSGFIAWRFCLLTCINRTNPQKTHQQNPSHPAPLLHVYLMALSLDQDVWSIHFYSTWITIICPKVLFFYQPKKKIWLISTTTRVFSFLPVSGWSNVKALISSTKQEQIKLLVKLVYVRLILHSCRLQMVCLANTYSSWMSYHMNSVDSFSCKINDPK